MSSTTQTKIVFPLPPPTTNSLTPSQRAQLLRKTRKLEQILGATPHLLDEELAPVHVTFPTNSRLHKTKSSDDFYSSSSSSSACSSPISSSSSICSSPSRHNRSGSLSRSPSTLRKNPPSFCSSPATEKHFGSRYETWSETKPPLLRLVDQPSAPLSPSDKSNRYTLSPSIPKTAKEASQPSFALSSGSIRKTKMDRIRKRLGEGVPIELVFPDGKKTMGHSRSSSLDSVVLEDFPTPRVRAKKTPGTIAGSRNSLVVEGSIHRAPRSSPTSSTPSTPTPAVPPLPPKPSSKKEGLVSIIESPDEHGSGYTCGSNTACSGSSSRSSLEDEFSSADIKVWSTRRGYEGWPAVKSERKVRRESWITGGTSVIAVIA